MDVAGIEPATPCLQNRNATFRKRFFFNHSIEDSRLSCPRKMCRDMTGCSHLHVGSLQKSLQSSATEEGAAA